MINQHPVPIKPFYLVPIKPLYLLLLVMAPVIIWIIYAFNIFGISRWFHTHPQYNGKVAVTKIISQADIQALAINTALDKWNARTYDSVSVPISAELKNKPELQYSYLAYGDKLGNVYVMVDVVPYHMYTSEVCKVYKVEGNNLLPVRNLPSGIWCLTGINMSTDDKGNWFVFGMPDVEGKLDVYKIEGTNGLYVPDLQFMQFERDFFYNVDDGSWYACAGGVVYDGVYDRYFKYYYKITFTP